jgi:hypothetical protein
MSIWGTMDGSPAETPAGVATPPQPDSRDGRDGD